MSYPLDTFLHITVLYFLGMYPMGQLRTSPTFKSYPDTNRSWNYSWSLSFLRCTVCCRVQYSSV